MMNTITDVPGIKVGHAHNLKAGTGCTVILCEKGAVAGVDVRGGAPGTREIDSLSPVNLVNRIHAIYLGGGSAFGLDGASGVMQYLKEHEIGFDAGVAKVPIVPGAVLFDLVVGSPAIWPDADMGYTACQQARAENCEQGSIGAGTGATVGKVAGPACIMKGGLGTASYSSGDLIVGAIVAVNCYGDVIDHRSGNILAGTLQPDKKHLANSMDLLLKEPGKGSRVFPTNTTIGVIATNVGFTKVQATKIAMMAHDGYARAINPVHTMYDGDTIFCVSTGDVESDITAIGSIAAHVMAQAIANAVIQAESLFGIPSYRDIYV
ncbi:MAG: P1 family peptidase [Spirochaetota bacterium]